MDNQMILYNSLTTPDGTTLISRSRHDYVQHVDKVTGKTYVIDGGHDYVKSSANGDERFNVIYYGDDHQSNRHWTHWGTRGKNGDQPLKYMSVSEMTSEHLQALISYFEANGVKSFPNEYAYTVYLVCKEEQRMRELYSVLA